MRHLLSLSLLLLSLISQAQIQVGGLWLNLNHPRKVSKEHFQQLRKTTTLFVLQDRDYEHLEDFDKAIKSAWTFTPYKIIRREEIISYGRRPGYSFFNFTAGSYINGSRHTARLYYALWMPIREKNGNSNPKEFGEIVMHANFIQNLMVTYGLLTEKSKLAVIDTLYNTQLETWGAGYLREYLREMNRLLAFDKVHNYFQDFSNKEAMQKLQQDTLFIPSYVNIRYNVLGAPHLKDRDEEDMAGSYRYPVKIVSSDSLNEMLLRAEKPINYVVYTQSSNSKFINVFNSGGGGLIYSAYDKMGRKFKAKDLRQINRRVRS